MKYLRKGSKVSIEEVKSGSTGLEYDIKFDAGEQAGEITVAKCWDYLLAEKLRDAVSEYMAEEYKVVGQEDAEMLEESSKKMNESGESWSEEDLKKLDNYIVDAKLAISQATSFIDGNASSGLDSMEEVWTHLNSTYDDLDDIQDMIDPKRLAL